MIIRFIATIFIILFFTMGCMPRSQEIEHPIPIETFAMEYLSMMHDPDNWYYQESPRTAYYPNNYELFSMGKLNASALSKYYWAEIGQYPSPSSPTSYDMTIHYYVFILTVENKSSFYLLTNWNTITGNIVYSGEIDLRKYETSVLLELKELIESGSDFDQIEYSKISTLAVIFEPEFEVIAIE